MADVPITIQIDFAKVESFASRGLTEEQVASSLGVLLKDINQDAQLLAQFKEAYQRGEAKGVAVISNLLFDKAKAGDTQAMIFFLKSKGWSDKPSLKSYKG